MHCMSRQIIHVDMDAFYASVEQLDRPDLQGEPVIVGGTAESRGVVSAASYEARKFGIHSAMPTKTALKLCPQAILLPVRMHRYQEVSQQIFEIFTSYTPQVEPISIDEGFLDVTGWSRFRGSASVIGQAIKAKIKEETGLTASVGIAPNKFLAKLASDLEKPDGFVIITEENKQRILDPLPVSKIWGVGKVTCQILGNHGIKTVGDLRRSSLSFLKSILGNSAEELLELAQGIDHRPVQTEHQAKNLSSEQTFATDIDDYETLRSVLYDQVQLIAARLRRKELLARTITLKLRYANFSTLTRSKTLSQATATTQTLWDAAHEVFTSWHERQSGALRLIGFGVSSLQTGSGQQQELFPDPQEQKQRHVDKALDAIHERFGKDAVRRGK